MKNILFKYFFAMAVIFSCSEDTASIEQLPNQSPEAFNLLSLTEGALTSNLLPTFTWEEAVDPEGEQVTYSIVMGKSVNTMVPVASGITDTNFTLNERLEFSEDFFWTVIAKDQLGAEQQANTIFTFSTRPINNGILAETTLRALHDHTTLVFQDKLWIIGGRDANSGRVLNSADGINWNLVTSNAAFLKKSNHSAVVFKDKMWVIGGENGNSSNTNDVWSSSDGIIWEQATRNAAFLPRQGQSSVVFDNKMWVIGGHVNFTSQSINDVWFSEDGVNWSPATNNANFQILQNHTTVVFNNKMYNISGNLVRFSTDGRFWQIVSEIPTFGATRQHHASVVFDNKLWAIGGLNAADQRDVWFSKDGIRWTLNTNRANFNERSKHTAITFNDKLWVIGGVRVFSNSGQDPNNGTWFLN